MKRPARTADLRALQAWPSFIGAGRQLTGRIVEPERPFLSTLKWVAIGALVGVLLILAWRLYSSVEQPQDDHALDEQARHKGS